MNRSPEHPTERREEHPSAADMPAGQAPPAGAELLPTDTAVQAPVQPPATPDEPTPLVGDA